MSFLIDKYAFRDGCCRLDVASVSPEFQVAVRGPCYSCGKAQEVIVADADLRKFRAGEYAQNCFPYLSAAAREFLISGICEKCWEEMFAETEEE
jgi:hypothetical protein